MTLYKVFKYFIFSFIFFQQYSVAQIYPDQHYVQRIDSIFANIETNVGLRLSDDGKSIILQKGVTDGYIILNPQTSEYPFDLGLISWNGTALNNNGSFKVQIRFPYGAVWSSWLTIGFWKANIWTSYGVTTFPDGKIDYDYAKLYVYKSSWQFKIIMTRTSVDIPSPTLHKLSFFPSDSRTTTSINYTAILNDNPDSIFIPTTFIYQYGVDPVIGGSICSPTSVSMILRSYGISVDPYLFALDTYDPYYKMFGIWPRVVQNASEFGLDGAVTRYRTWSQARDTEVANYQRRSLDAVAAWYETPPPAPADHHRRTDHDRADAAGPVVQHHVVHHEHLGGAVSRAERRGCRGRRGSGGAVERIGCGCGGRRPDPRDHGRRRRRLVAHPATHRRALAPNPGAGPAATGRAGRWRRERHAHTWSTSATPVPCGGFRTRDRRWQGGRRTPSPGSGGTRSRGPASSSGTALPPGGTGWPNPLAWSARPRRSGPATCGCDPSAS